MFLGVYQIIMTTHLYKYSMLILGFLAHAGIVFYTLLWMMILLTAGTIAQKYVGLYVAQNTFFNTWILWLGPLPLPSGMMTLALLAIGLMAKLAIRTTWTWRKAGTITAHFGALLLLLGGLWTYSFSKEGQITMGPGDRSAYMTAYNDRHLTVESNNGKIPPYTIPWDDLKPGQVFYVPHLPLSIEVIKVCRNCTFLEREQPLSEQDQKELKGRAKVLDITPAPLQKQDEMNRAAILFRLSGSHSDKDGIHLSTDFIDLSPWVDIEDTVYNIALRKIRSQIPFEIELVEFKKETHPGTAMASSYESEVIVHDTPSNTSWRAHIRMNEPLRIRGYTLYQASYIDQGDDKYQSVFAVVKNSGRIFPYLASFVMCLGLFIQIFIRFYKLKHPKKEKNGADGKRPVPSSLLPVLLTALLLSGIGASAPAHADWFSSAKQNAYETPALAEIPILDQGRIKPMDTFARSWLEVYSGRDHLGDQTALGWLLDVLFKPDIAVKQPIFKISHPAVRDMLDLPSRKGGRYTFEEVYPSLQKQKQYWDVFRDVPQDRLTMPQRQLLEIVDHIESFFDLMTTFEYTRPQITIESPALAQKLGLPAMTPISPIEMQKHHKKLEAAFNALSEKAKIKKPTDHMSQDEAELTSIVIKMRDIDQQAGRVMFRIIPGKLPGDEWQTPIAAFETENSVIIKNVQVLSPLWNEMATSYRSDNTAAFIQATTTLAQQSKIIAGPAAAQNTLTLEYLYHTYNPFGLSVYGYLLAFIFFAGRLLILGHAGRHVLHTVQTLGWISLLGAIALHTGGIVIRMILTSRPPVTNLYDSILFVGLTGVLFSIFAHYTLSKSGIALMIAAVIGFLLQLVGLYFDSEGDTLRVLVAVLDTNFWLSVHVTMMTMGYAAALVMALMAHGYLMARIIGKRTFTQLSGLHTHTQIMMVIALFFSAFGTLLGGIWADQSWGRFWGWDPKENGALLLTLWLIWAMHARISRHFSADTLMIIIALTTVIVAAAWFGVNLLGVGLHSYGFTTAALTGFIAFCTIESLLALCAYAAIRQLEIKEGIRK